ncbi:MAG: glycoside hydrolase family 5 protein [Bacteroidota bacterium]|nr:glycoside hydrolase family 5 protein [Bacteroidota bacterium]
MKPSGRIRKFIFLAVCIVIAGIVFLGLRERNVPEGQVYMRNGKFEINGEAFHPMILNYIVAMQTDGKEVWPAAYPGYTAGYRFPYSDPDQCLSGIDADLKLIKQLGFNGVRIVKLAEGPVRDRNTGELYIKAFTWNAQDTLLSMTDDESYTNYSYAIKQVIDLVEANAMKVILLTDLQPDNEHLMDHWKKVIEPLADEPAIMAFDMFNEPLYFDSLDRSKEDVHRIVKHWRKLMGEELPHHLFTIGLQGIRETFEWDPNILDVDFISFHPYEYEPDQVRNEMRWYFENVDVPWIIGETSLPADNDSVPYSDQVEFATKVLQQSHACGSCGFSWWQYKDVGWGIFHSDHMGLVAMNGEIEIEGARVNTQGTPKPTVEVFQEFNPSLPRKDCVLLPNYLNYSQHTTSLLSGRLLDQDRRPIEGGVVIGWNEHWSKSFHTTSEADGSFKLRGDFYFHHWMATATRHSWVRNDVRPDAFLTRGKAIPEYFLGELLLEPLPFIHPREN